MWCMLSPKSKMTQQASLLLLSRIGGRVRSSSLSFMLEGSCHRPDFQKIWLRWQATIILFLCLAWTSKIHNILRFKSPQLGVISIVVRVISYEIVRQNPDEPDLSKERSQ